MKDLVDYLHAKGMLAGIYTDVGPQTRRYEGSYDHDEVDALTYAQWGTLIEDACHKPENHSYAELYMRMHNAILKAHDQTGHAMMFYMCVWGSENVYEWGPTHGTLWRTTGDICLRGTRRGAHAANFRGNVQHPNATRVGACKIRTCLWWACRGSRRWKARTSRCGAWRPRRCGQAST